MAHSRYVAEPFPLFAVLFGAVWADTLGHVVYGFYLESGGIVHLWYREVLQTECAVTHLTMEMYVAVIICVAMGVAQLIAYALATVINLMEQVVLLKECECAEYTRLINGINLVLQLGHSDWAVHIGQGLKHQKTVGSGLDAMLVQCPLKFVHFFVKVFKDTQKEPSDFAVFV